MDASTNTTSGPPPFAGVFETGDPAIMRTAVERDVPEDIEDLPAPVNVALRKALAKDPKDRFASCGEFVEECLARSPRSPQSDSHTETQRHGDGGARMTVRVGSQEIALRLCPPGTFTMGLPSSENGRDDDETQHSVTLSRGFWMGETEVTQGLWKEVCHGSYPCGTTAKGPFRLKTVPVRSYQPNAWGLYDMHGNVWEWCSDWFGRNYPTGAVRDPAGPSTGSYRVNCGGSWNGNARYCRSAYRGGSDPGYRSDYLGLRVALAPVQ